jgi:isohexenylglutaconyl-CoA hydratase
MVLLASALEVGQASFQTLVVKREGPVLHVTLNRPALRNAMSLHMVAELRQVLADAEAGGQSRVVVLRGAGGHFCAGADLKDMANARMQAMHADRLAKSADVTMDAMAQANIQFGELCVAYAKTPLALVAVLEGSVMGGGLGLACVADVALASETAVFRLPETGLGVVPAQIAPFLVERLGYSQAKRLAVTGGRLCAVEALTMGLVHAVHAPDQMDAALTALLADILACAPGAVAATKALMARARLTETSHLLRDAAIIFSNAVHGPEGQEGTMAFLQKRKPTWAMQ